MRIKCPNCGWSESIDSYKKPICPECGMNSCIIYVDGDPVSGGFAIIFIGLAVFLLIYSICFKLL